MDNLKEDRTFTIGKASELLGIQQHTLRFYEKELGLIISRTTNGRRYYTLSDINLFKHIKKFRDDDKLHLDGIKQQLIKNGMLEGTLDNEKDKNQVQVGFQSKPLFSTSNNMDLNSNSLQNITTLSKNLSLENKQQIIDELSDILKLLQSDK